MRYFIISAIVALAAAKANAQAEDHLKNQELRKNQEFSEQPVGRREIAN